ncbi:MAG: DNA-binding response regulator [Balneolaceae bacterium]|nr:MAG: DNA-binding response regulator [Balneolaceae bacterium]
MNTDGIIRIVIIAESRPRSITLSKMISEGLEQPLTVEIKNLTEIDHLNKHRPPDVFILDLLSLDHPASYVIQQIMEVENNSRVILLHVYQSSELVMPFYEMGVDGYLYCEPKRNDLAEAIETVADGRIYYPPFLSVAGNT